MNTKIPDIIDASGAVLKASKKKGSHCSNASFSRTVRTIWKGLDRTLTQTGSNYDLIIEMEFTELLSRLSKDTAPGPDKVKY